eukprot:TRINITY_DN21912_c0_g1_i1.p1 TRINITY_DN21912_c0_g1~~TRINITY_DN21912_c0_g1_i1.p1  ORF type:complete len:333 (-),score=46.20 TRINITY_DN21912_c0_g1_i1:63-1061(-)
MGNKQALQKGNNNSNGETKTEHTTPASSFSGYPAKFQKCVQYNVDKRTELKGLNGALVPTEFGVDVTFKTAEVFEEHGNFIKVWGEYIMEIYENKELAFQQKEGNENQIHLLFPENMQTVEMLGCCLAYCNLNKPPDVMVNFWFAETRESGESERLTLGSVCFGYAVDKYREAFAATEQNVQGYPMPCQFPHKNIRVFHIHGHFDDSCENESLQLHHDLQQTVRNAGESITFERVLKAKNGPHDKWGWEAHVTTTRALGFAVLFLARWIHTYAAKKVVTDESSESAKGIYVLYHVRTLDGSNKNEYNDHIYRLGWIGPQDPQPLDIEFFHRW